MFIKTAISLIYVKIIHESFILLLIINICLLIDFRKMKVDIRYAEGK